MCLVRNSINLLSWNNSKNVTIITNENQIHKINSSLEIKGLWLYYVQVTSKEALIK